MTVDRGDPVDGDGAVGHEVTSERGRVVPHIGVGVGDVGKVHGFRVVRVDSAGAADRLAKGRHFRDRLPAPPDGPHFLDGLVLVEVSCTEPCVPFPCKCLVCVSPVRVGEFVRESASDPRVVSALDEVVPKQNGRK